MDFYKWLRKIVHPAPAEQRKQAVAEITEAASPGFNFFLMIVLSCSIATLGLITNSPAVIIGAMLVAPLMSPFVGIGLAPITSDARLAEASVSTLTTDYYSSLRWRLGNGIRSISILSNLDSRFQPTPAILRNYCFGSLWSPRTGFVIRKV